MRVRDVVVFRFRKRDMDKKDCTIRIPDQNGWTEKHLPLSIEIFPAALVTAAQFSAAGYPGVPNQTPSDEAQIWKTEDGRRTISPLGACNCRHFFPPPNFMNGMLSRLLPLLELARTPTSTDQHLIFFSKFEQGEEALEREIHTV